MTRTLLGMAAALAVLLPIWTGAPTEAQERLQTQTPGQRWTSANESFDRGDYAEAIAGYQGLLQEQPGTADLYFNLGTAHLRNGNLGGSIASLRRAELLAPRDPDIRGNLARARASVVDDVAPPEPPALLRTFFFWYYGMNQNELWWTLAVLNLLLWSALAWRQLRPRHEIALWIAIGSGVPAAILAGALMVQFLQPPRVGVVQSREAVALAGTQADSGVRFKVHAGTELRVEQMLGDWVLVSLPDGTEGWLHREELEIVER